jgi:hypothetical protein
VKSISVHGTAWSTLLVGYVAPVCWRASVRPPNSVVDDVATIFVLKPPLDKFRSPYLGS